MKRIITLLSLLLVAAGAFAQDKLYTRDGDELSVFIKEVTPRVIRYKKEESGPFYSLNRRDVEKIVYENGTEETMDDDRRTRRSRAGAGEDDKKSMDRRMAMYGNNSLSLALIQLTDRSTTGMGLQYERAIDRRGIFHVYLPVAFSLVHDQYTNYGTQVNGRDYHEFTYLYPGVKIYPAGSRRVFAYAVGPSIAIGFGKEYQYNTLVDPTTGSFYTVKQAYSNFRMGVMVNNSLNFQPTPHLHMGLEFGIGFLYFNDYSSGYNNQYGYDVEDPIANFNFNIGYRF